MAELNNGMIDPTQEVIKSLKKHYSKTLVEHCVHPRNLQKMDQPDGYAQSTARDGDFIEMFVLLENKTVKDCTFMTNGCAATLACGSLATELVKDKSWAQAFHAISPENIIASLGGLPEGNVHCAQLVSKVCRLALADGLAQGKNSWKKAYRRF